MTISYQELLSRSPVHEKRTYDQAKVQLYSVGVGMGMDPLDQQQLAFLQDGNLKVLPSFASLAAWDIGFTLELGMQWAKLIHVSQRVNFAGPMRPSANIDVFIRCKAAFNKPAQNSTLLLNEVRMVDTDRDAELAVLENIYLARDFHLPDAPVGKPDALPVPPNRLPDLELSMPTSPQVALIYRLLGGRAPIHCDPKIARAEGFDGPIMHGLSTFGHVCHAVLKGACNYEPERLRAVAADFRSPVYPGEILLNRLWFEGQNIHFESLVPERDVVVIGNGIAIRDY